MGQGAWAGGNELSPNCDEDKVSTRSYFVLVSWLYYYLGPCDNRSTKCLMRFTTIRASLGPGYSYVLEEIWQYLQAPLTGYLTQISHCHPRIPSSYQRAGGILGFERAVGALGFYYTGHWVWRPGIDLFTFLLGAAERAAFSRLSRRWSGALFTRWRVYIGAGFSTTAICYCDVQLSIFHLSNAYTRLSIRWGRCWWEVCWWRCGKGCGPF